MLQGKISSIFSVDAPKGDYEAPEGVFPNGSPPHVEDFGPSHRNVVIEPTAVGNIGSRGIAANRDNTGGGQSHHVHQGGCDRGCKY